MDRVVPLVISPFAFFFLHFSKAEKEPQTVILVSMDGMPWNLISGEFANTPNLDKVAKNGVTAKYIETVVPSKTWPTHVSFVTGLYPESQGFQQVLGSSLQLNVYPGV